MPWKIKGELKGLQEAVKALDGLKRGVRNKILRRAVTAAARITLRAIKAVEKARRTGQLKRSLGMKVRTYSSGRVIAVIGPRKGFGMMLGKRKIDPVKYAHLVEGGTKPHALGKGSRLRKNQQSGQGHPGSEAQPFMQPGWEASRDAAAEKATALIAEGIEQEAAKLAKAA